MEPGRRAIVKEFYANLGEMKDLTCYVKGRWISFRERILSQLLKLRIVGDCKEMSSCQGAKEWSKMVEKDQDHSKCLHRLG